MMLPGIKNTKRCVIKMRMKDIADLAGVSMATVSRVINQPEMVREDTRTKVQKILEETDFVANAVARGLAIKSMNTVGILAADIRDMYFSNVTYTIERYFSELGYNVILSNTGGQLGEKKKYLRLMLEKQVDGLILVGSVFKEHTDNKHIIAASKTVPIVLVNSYLEGENTYSVLCDDAYGVENAVNHLALLGHKNILYYHDINSFSGLAKLKGFKEGLKNNDLKQGRIVELPRTIQGSYDRTMELYSQSREYTAIITGEDITAIGGMKALTRLGINIPGEVAVVGYDNSILAQAATPTLTSIDSMSEAMAMESARLLYGIFTGQQVSKKTVLSPTLAVRESTQSKVE